jgi:hypothetical protein
MWGAGKRSATVFFLRGSLDLRFSPAGTDGFLLGGKPGFPFAKRFSGRPVLAPMSGSRLGDRRDRNWLPTTQSIERVSGRSQEREFSMQRQGDKISDFGTYSTAETAQTKKQGTHVFEISDVLRVSLSHHNYREWVVETGWIELAAHHPVIEPVSDS